MIGIGTLLNALGIIAGGIMGRLCGKFMKPHFQDTLMKAAGLCVMFVGLGGTMEKMLSVSSGSLTSDGTMMMIGSFAIGSVLGEWINLEEKMERFGEWLKIRTGNSREKLFVDGFVTASLTVCIGAMAIVGSIQDGIYGDYSVLALKAVLDFIIIWVMTASLGKGCMFSAIPVILLQGSVTLMGKMIEPFMTEQALHNLSFTGSMLIFCVGINLIWEKKFKVANMLPTILVAIIWAFI